MNINLEILVHGSGLKGFLKLTYNCIKCMFGKHRIIGYVGFRKNEEGVKKIKMWKACAYCRKGNINE